MLVTRAAGTTDGAEAGATASTVAGVPGLLGHDTSHEAYVMMLAVRLVPRLTRAASKLPY